MVLRNHPDLHTIDPTLNAREGFIEHKGYLIWYAVVGEATEQPNKLPLLLLHGGPGMGHDYLEPIAAMSRNGRRVIFFDQLGCGNSQLVDQPTLWTVEFFVEEVNVVREALGLKHIHLLGQSWGGMLAMEYALTQAPGVASLSICSSPASMKQWLSEANRLRELLPSEVQATLLKHELNNTWQSKDYQEAMGIFYDRHVCRVKPLPECVSRMFTKVERWPQVYHTMNGVTEFHVTGTLKDWDIVHRLPEITYPTLITSGQHDECTPLIAETVHKGIKDSKWVLFEHSSHTSHIEETDRFISILGDFLSEYDPK